MAKSIIIKDNSRAIIDSLKALTQHQVLIGIPEEKDARDSGPITNAALGYIHEFGAPGANIPARPFLIPGVRKAEREASPHLRSACLAALDGKLDVALRQAAMAGIIAENSAKREITTGDFVPLKPSTIAARYRSRDTGSQRKSETRYMELIHAGSSPAAAQAAAGIKPLINTAQLRNSITSVVRKAK
jgi:hypothetical protein